MSRAVGLPMEERYTRTMPLRADEATVSGAESTCVADALCIGSIENASMATISMAAIRLIRRMHPSSFLQDSSE